MSRRHRNRFRPQAVNAVRPPQTPQLVIEPVKLKTMEWLGVVNLIGRQQMFEQQQREFMANQAALHRDKQTVFAEIEAAYNLPRGAIERGEWTIQDGHLICQSPQQQQQQQQTGTEG